MAKGLILPYDIHFSSYAKLLFSFSVVQVSLYIKEKLYLLKNLYSFECDVRMTMNNMLG
jgi:hypothetical protein